MSAAKKLVILPAVAVLLGAMLWACSAASTAQRAEGPAFQTPVATVPPTPQPAPVPEPPEVQIAVAAQTSVATVPPTPQAVPVPEPPEIRSPVAAQTPAPAPVAGTDARADESDTTTESSAAAAIGWLQAGEIDLYAARGLDRRLLDTVKSDSNLCTDGSRSRP